MADIDMVDTETLAAACRTAAVSSAFADLLNAAAARLLAMQSWIDGAKVDMAAMEESLCGFSEEWHSRIIAERNEARAEAQKATAWHMEALDDLSACAAERDDLRRRYDAIRDGVTRLCDGWESGANDYDGEPLVNAEVFASDLRAVVARVEEATTDPQARWVEHEVYAYGQQHYDGDACRTCGWQGPPHSGEQHKRETRTLVARVEES